MPSLKSPEPFFTLHSQNSQFHLFRTLTFLSSCLMENFSRLTTDIVLDIITRLPTESVLECKLVCTPWRNPVSYHPSFSQIHLTHLNQSADSSKLSFLVLDEDRHFYYFEYNENNDETPIDGIRRIKFTPPMECSRYTLLGSINGLACFFWIPRYLYLQPRDKRIC